MAEECEVKFLNVNIEELETKLKKLGAKKVGEFHYKRRVYDYPDRRLDKKGAWIRLRTDDKKTTLCYKERIGIKSHDGKTNDKTFHEVEFEVSDFEKAKEFMDNLGFKEKFYEENTRIRYMLNDIEFDIDTWPLLKPYLEIEAPTWDQVNEGIKLLELDPKDKKIFSTYQVYQLEGIDEFDFSVLTFAKQIKK
ncbi:MAG: class IV adenylate cyclase [bacterium]